MNKLVGDIFVLTGPVDVHPPSTATSFRLFAWTCLVAFAIGPFEQFSDGVSTEAFLFTFNSIVLVSLAEGVACALGIVIKFL